MSRSRRKTPIIGWTNKETEKLFKRQENKRMRAKVRSEDIEANPREFKSSYGPKDGKQYFGVKWPWLMRK